MHCYDVRFKKFAFGSRICFQIFLEICTLGTYDDVVNYVIHKSEIRHVYSVVRVKRFQEVEYFARI